MSEDDVNELRQSTEEFSVSLSDIDTLQERIKLLQEEISALVQEQNNRSLFVLSPFTVLALPVNMIAGFFGMDVGGIPLAQNEAGFAIVVAAILSVTAVVGSWLFRNRRQRTARPRPLHARRRIGKLNSPIDGRFQIFSSGNARRMASLQNNRSRFPLGRQPCAGRIPYSGLAQRRCRAV